MNVRPTKLNCWLVSTTPTTRTLEETKNPNNI